MTNASTAPTLGPQSDLHYHHNKSVALPMAITPLGAWNIITGKPGPLMRLAFGARDAISSLFGIERIGGFSGAKRESAQSGDHLDFFLVEHSTPDMLILTQRDRHLDVMLCLSIADQRLTITTSVVTHNAFGRVYMLPVGPMHNLIVRRDLRRLIRKLTAMGADTVIA